MPDVSDERGLDLAKFQQNDGGGGGGKDTGADLPADGPVDVIYCRFSSELQRADSNADQERRCRDRLDRLGIPHAHFVVLADQAVSGTADSRPAFDVVRGLLKAGRLRTLISTEQSRVSRGDNVKSFVKDVVFHGGRFLTVTEGIDTVLKGWEFNVSFSEMHHSRSTGDTADRVRGAQEGRVRDGDGSAGDFPFGYASEYLDPAAAAGFRGRGPKPKKRVVVEAAAAAVVVEILRRFAVDGESISAIVRWWEAHRHELPTVTGGRVHHEHVRRILTNAKYVGRWTFGATTTVYSGTGEKKQVAARADQVVTVVERPGLRIVDQATWDLAQARLAELKAIYGMKPGGRKRGPAEHYRKLYDRTLLGGLVRCGQGGATRSVGRGGAVKRLACPAHAAGACPMAGGLRYDEAQRAILDVVAQALLAYPDWIRAAVAATRQELERAARAVPDDLAAARGGLADVAKRLSHLVDALAGGLDSPAVRERLAGLEADRAALAARVARLERAQGAAVEMPPDEWIRGQLADVAGLLEGNLAPVARALRAVVGTVVAEQVLAPGKTRGFMRLRFTLDGPAALAHLLGGRLPPPPPAGSAPHASATAAAVGAAAGRSGEFVVDLGGPTPMDRWGPQVVRWRDAGVTWAEIARRTGLKLANACVAYRRHKGGDQGA